jgi:uncharacterized protein
MIYSFMAYGHKNVLASHKKTLEITKDSELTESGDCVVAVKADFSFDEIRELIADGDEITLTIEVNGVEEKVKALVNKDFSSEEEIVLRKGDFLSERTLGINCDKAASDLNRELVSELAEEGPVKITIESIDS